MSAPTVTFWPADLANRVVRSPVAVLRQAAGELTTMTGGLLEGTVTMASSVTSNGGVVATPHVTYALSVVASGLDRYSVGLLTLEHEGKLVYPVEVSADEIERADGLGTSNHETCHDDLELTSAIQRILRSDRVRAILVSLLAQLNDDSEQSVNS